MSPKELEIAVGETAKVTAIQTGNISVQTLPTYTSSDESIATVDDFGNVTGNKAGTATITGKYGNNYVAGTTKVTVVKAPEVSNNASLIIADNNYIPVPALVLNEEYGFWIYLRDIPDTQKKNVKVTINNEKVAKLTGVDLCDWEDGSGKGLLIANTKLLSVGKFTITATLSYNGKTYTDSYTGTVTKSGFTLNLMTTDNKTLPTTMKVGDTLQIRVNRIPVGAAMLDDVTSEVTSWKSSNEKVLKVNKGLVTAVGEGKATITATYEGESAKCELVVTEKSKWEGKMTPTTLEVEVGKTGKVSAEQTGLYAVDTFATYESSDSSIATVDTNGTVRGIKVGTCTITGKYGKDLIAGTTEVTVIESSTLEWTGEMTPTRLEINVGETAQVTAKQTGSLQINTFATYESSNTSIATVDREGIVRGIKAGTAYITGKFGNKVAGTSKVTVNDIGDFEWTGEMTPKLLKLRVGESGKVTAKQTGTVLIKKLATYESNNTEVATVDNSGNVVGVKSGNAIITGRFGEYVAGTTKVTVIGGNALVWSNASEWAITELNNANSNGIIPEIFENQDLTEKITRREFAHVAVKLWEIITGNTAKIGTQNPFTDTNDLEVLKAYQLEITNGTSETTFSPEELITREQMATMLKRTLSKAGINTYADTTTTTRFNDDNQMHDWGKEAIYYMSKNELIKGVGDNTFDVLGNATIEQAILISERSAEKFAQ